MNYTKYSSSVPDNEDDSMEWEEDKDTEKPGACVGEDGTLGDPHIAHGYAFSQPGTSGYTGQKRKSTFSSPLRTKTSRNIWNGKQQQDYPSAIHTNLYNIREIASGFSIAPPIPQMMLVEPRGISNQAVSDKTSENDVNDDASCSKVDISTEPIHGISTAAGTTREFHGFPDVNEAREKIINPLNAETPPYDTEVPLGKTEGTVSGLEFALLLHKDLFCNTLKLPVQHRNIL